MPIGEKASEIYEISEACTLLHNSRHIAAKMHAVRYNHMPVRLQPLAVQ